MTINLLCSRHTDFRSYREHVGDEEENRFYFLVPLTKWDLEGGAVLKRTAKCKGHMQSTQGKQSSSEPLCEVCAKTLRPSRLKTINKSV